MATCSFDRSFEIKDAQAAEKLRKALSVPHPVKVTKRDIGQESKKGIELLKRSSSAC
jgi:hypothetical protein